jgi:RNA polymerase-binding transcription factor DksA
VSDPHDNPTGSDWSSDPGADIRRLDAIGAELAGVDAALLRLDEGTYGTCQVCGADLHGEAIERDPLAERCPAHVG